MGARGGAGRAVQPAGRAARAAGAGASAPARGHASRPSTARYAGTLLAAGSPHARRDLYLVEQEPGTVRQAEPHIPGSVEHLIVAAGRMRAGPAEAPVELGPGDYICVPRRLAHSYEALEPGTWAVLVMEHL